jgi:hypothetical protein
MDTKDIAIIYGGTWVGKGVDKLLNMYAPAQASVVKVALATVLPLLSIAPIRMPEVAKDVSLLVGAYLATKA